MKGTFWVGVGGRCRRDIRKQRWKALQVNVVGGGGQISFKNAAEEKSLEVNYTAKMMPFMLARSPFHLPLLPEEGGGGWEGEEDLKGEAARVTQCIKREKVILNQC